MDAEAMKLAKVLFLMGKPRTTCVDSATDVGVVDR